MDKKKRQSLSIDRAAFILLRIKKVFKKKKVQLNESAYMTILCRTDQRAASVSYEGTRRIGRKCPPLLRSKTLPAIFIPSGNILAEQLGNQVRALYNVAQQGQFDKTRISLDTNVNRFAAQLEQLDQLIEEVRQYRPGNEILESHGPLRKIQKRKTTIKQLFSAASKFQRNLHRGIYLACILYHEDRVLLTNEDFLPVIEIDEIFPNCIHTDLYWLMKVSCIWNETKVLRFEMEKHISSRIHFRKKILSAVIQMQSLLCLQDLGQIYHKPLKDSRGTMVLSIVNYVKSPRNVSLLNSRWLPMSKVFKKIVLSDDHNLSEMLMASIKQQIHYHQVSSLKLNRGLYLAYLKMQSSVDTIEVIVSSKSPNILPHCKIRDNPHVTSEEWGYLKQLNCPEVVNNASELQKNFLDLVTSASKRLFNYMDVNSDDIITHRIYESNIIELNDEVSFIVICPSAELSCAVPGQRELLLQRGDLLSLPIKVFEMIHLNTYRPSITKKYAKLSCSLELDIASADHLHREAFSNNEIAIAKSKLLKLQELQTKMNVIWNSVRWLMSVITFARDRVTPGISVRCLVQTEQENFTTTDLLQLPPEEKLLKHTLGRGSWPGPGHGIPPSNIITEFSKSEQNLTVVDFGTNNYTDTIENEEDKRRSSTITPAKSENTLCTQQRIRANTICNMSSSDIPKLTAKQSNSLASVNVTDTSNSVNSVSSDSDCGAQTFLGSFNKRRRSKMISSKSMTNVKQNIKLDKVKSTNRTLLHPDLNSSLSRSLTNFNTCIDYETSKCVESVKDSDKKSISSTVLCQQIETKNENGILQVFAAYETGLASGTSLKLHVTPQTTAREVVDLVVKQLNMAVILKGKDGPVYDVDKLNNFCLVAVIGARERCLRDDFKPLHLQNPWRQGRLYVRQKQDVLAALEHSSKHTLII
ncbi:ankyrin repeat and fibronectin type-III domain-containing protein 1 isoform X1 [Diorhabda sublineata]|uniref:ankyrin repeat and fibronectin type-III domain-containing protein 1 isoform X1 n=1 Tax=Diorhabda sublineata TaxID=1163346 RepID=UPI0024E11E5D|nr:ankyrin repeat and fibronectin type-III domain-containing protein 1 isoform X1 [Diorhabda sublineata]